MKKESVPSKGRLSVNLWPPRVSAASWKFSWNRKCSLASSRTESWGNAGLKVRVGVSPAGRVSLFRPAPAGCGNVPPCPCAHGKAETHPGNPARLPGRSLWAAAAGGGSGDGGMRDRPHTAHPSPVSVRRRALRAEGGTVFGRAPGHGTKRSKQVPARPRWAKSLEVFLKWIFMAVVGFGSGLFWVLFFNLKKPYPRWTEVVKRFQCDRNYEKENNENIVKGDKARFNCGPC